MRKRTQAREITLQALYQFDIQRQIDESLVCDGGDFEAFIVKSTDDPEVRDYARELLEGVLASLPELDEQIASVSENWRLNRTAAVDRCVLRIGLFEMLESSEVPPKVAINEAIDLAKKYSAEQSGAFVNGILDKIYALVRESREPASNS